MLNFFKCLCWYLYLSKTLVDFIDSLWQGQSFASQFSFEFWMGQLVVFLGRWSLLLETVFVQSHCPGFEVRG